MSYVCPTYVLPMSYLYRIPPIPIIYFVYYPVILENLLFYIQKYGPHRRVVLFVCAQITQRFQQEVLLRELFALLERLIALQLPLPDLC